MDEQKNNDLDGVSRRGLFQILGATPALAALAGGVPAVAGEVNAKSAGPYKRKVLDDHQWNTVGVLSDIMIPADERSGSATQAGVPEFIDDWLDFRNDQDGNQNFSAQILGGLTWLDVETNRLFQKSFIGCDSSQQKQILDRIAWPDKAAPEDKAWAKFFDLLRDLVVSGFFSSKMGVGDLPYLGNRAVMHWQGCDPKVWAIIEQRMKTGYEGVGGNSGPIV